MFRWFEMLHFHWIWHEWNTASCKHDKGFRVQKCLCRVLQTIWRFKPPKSEHTKGFWEKQLSANVAGPLTAMASAVRPRRSRTAAGLHPKNFKKIAPGRIDYFTWDLELCRKDGGPPFNLHVWWSFLFYVKFSRRSSWGAAGFGNQVVKRFFGKKDWRVCGLWQSYYIPRQKKFSLLPPVSKHWSFSTTTTYQLGELSFA